MTENKDSNTSRPKTIHIVGKKNSGKTTLIVELISSLKKRGFKVGSIKHSSHAHDIDRPGKDSHRHRTAGANPSAFITPVGIGIFIDRNNGEDDPYSIVEKMFADCEIVIVEGGIDRRDELKIEVWRKQLSSPPLAENRTDIRALITDDPPPSLEKKIPIWPRSDIDKLTDKIISLLK